MNRKYLWTAIVGAAAFGAMFAFTPPAQWLEMGASLAVGLVLMGGLMVPAVRRAALRHRSASLAGGVVALCLAAGILMAGITLAPQLSPGFVSGAVVVLLLAGLLLLQAPRFSANMERAAAVQKTLEGVKPSGFRPGAEVEAALDEIVGQRAAFARLVGPWFALVCLLALGVGNLDFWKGVLAAHRGLTLPFLLGVLVALLAGVSAVLVAAIQWTRFVATGREPAWSDFPGKALWGWSWRWLIYGAVLSRTSQIEPWLGAHLPGATAWELKGLGVLAALSIFVLASPFALVLPAVAVDAPDKGLSSWSRAFRTAGRGYYLGAAMILGPYFILSKALELAAALYKAPLVQATCVLADFVLVFLVVMLGMTYVARVYRRGEIIAVPEVFA